MGRERCFDNSGAGGKMDVRPRKALAGRGAGTPQRRLRMQDEGSARQPESGRGRIVVRMEAETDPAFGSRPGERSLAGRLLGCLVVLDKPAGMTSRSASDEVGRAIGVRGTGHSGTLDPAVTGVLPVGAGTGLKVLELLLASGKEYEGTMAVHGAVDPGELAEAAGRFVGEIVQVPPVRSRVKREPRKRLVHAFGITGVEGRRARFRCAVQAGTYVRKLVHDLGEALGCGAHMTGLRRTKAGPFTLRDAVGLDDLFSAAEESGRGSQGRLSAMLLPPEAACGGLRAVWAADGAVARLLAGSPLFLPGVIKLESGIVRGEEVAMLTLKDELIAVGRAEMSSEEMASLASGAAVRVRKAVMLKGVYP